MPPTAVVACSVIPAVVTTGVLIRMACADALPTTEERFIVNGRGVEFRGMVAAGATSGFGVFTTSNGSVYAGQFSGVTLEGVAVLSARGGGTFFGTFSAGDRDGFGVLEFPSGTRYAGQFSQDVQAGFGVIEYADGDSYAGQFRDDEPHGIGLYVVSCYGLEASCQVVGIRRVLLWRSYTHASRSEQAIVQFERGKAISTAWFNPAESSHALLLQGAQDAKVRKPPSTRTAPLPMQQSASPRTLRPSSPHQLKHVSIVAHGAPMPTEPANFGCHSIAGSRARSLGDGCRSWQRLRKRKPRELRHVPRLDAREWCGAGETGCECKMRSECAGCSDG
jgi:hypothetical protein